MPASPVCLIGSTRPACAFLVKRRLGWLTLEQARLAFCRFFGVEVPCSLDSLRTLRPADFVLVGRFTTVRSEDGDPAGLLHLLTAKCEDQPGSRPPVRFRAA